jgi:hypothetical protein
VHYLLLRILKQYERSVAKFPYQLVNEKIQFIIVFIYEWGADNDQSERAGKNENQNEVSARKCR